MLDGDGRRGRQGCVLCTVAHQNLETTESVNTAARCPEGGAGGTLCCPGGDLAGGRQGCGASLSNRDFNSGKSEYGNNVFQSGAAEHVVVRVATWLGDGQGGAAKPRGWEWYIKNVL